MPNTSLSRSHGALAAVVTTTAWGGQFVVGPVAFRSVHPVWVTTVRYLFAGAVLALILAAREGWESFAWDRQTARAYGLGAIGFAGFNLLAYVGLSHTRPQDASLIVATMPLVTAFVLWVRGRVRPAPEMWAAALVALAGVSVVLTGGRPASLIHGGINGGDLLVFGGVVAWVVYTTGAATLPDFSPMRYTGVSVVGGSVAITLIAVILSALGLVPVATAADTARIWWELLYLAVPGAVIAMLAWTGAVRSLGAQDASLFINIVPVTTFAVEAALGHPATPAQLAGVALVISAVAGANLISRHRRIPATAAVATTAPMTTSTPASSAAVLTGCAR